MRAVLFFILCVTGSVIVNRFISYLSLQKTRRELTEMLHNGDFDDMSGNLWTDSEDGEEPTANTMSWSDKDIYSWLRETYPHKDFMYYEGNVVGTDNFEVYCDAFRNESIAEIVVSKDDDDDENNTDRELFWNDADTEPVAAGDFFALRDLAADLADTLKEQI